MALGNQIPDKTLLNAVTCGARRDVYTTEGGYRHELRDYFVPFEQTALLCRMRYLPPFALFGAGHAAAENRLQDHLTDYTRLLGALAEGRLDLDRAESEQTLSDNLAELISDPEEGV